MSNLKILGRILLWDQFGLCIEIFYWKHKKIFECTALLLFNRYIYRMSCIAKLCHQWGVIHTTAASMDVSRDRKVRPIYLVWHLVNTSPQEKALFQDSTIYIATWLLFQITTIWFDWDVLLSCSGCLIKSGFDILKPCYKGFPES